MLMAPLSLLNCPNEILEIILEDVFNLGDRIADNLAEDPFGITYIPCTNKELMSPRLACKLLDDLASRRYTSKLGLINIYKADTEESDPKDFQFMWLNSLESLANSPGAWYVTHLCFKIHWPLSLWPDDADSHHRRRQQFEAEMSGLHILGPEVRTNFNKVHTLLIRSPNLPSRDVLTHEPHNDVDHCAKLSWVLIRLFSTNELRSLDVENFRYRDFEMHDAAQWSIPGTGDIQRALKSITKLRLRLAPASSGNQTSDWYWENLTAEVLTRMPGLKQLTLEKRPGIVLAREVATWPRNLSVMYLSGISLDFQVMKHLFQSYGPNLRVLVVSRARYASTDPPHLAARNIVFTNLKAIFFEGYTNHDEWATFLWRASHHPKATQQLKDWVDSIGWEDYTIDEIDSDSSADEETHAEEEPNSEHDVSEHEDTLDEEEETDDE